MSTSKNTRHAGLALFVLFALSFLSGCAQYCETYDGYNCILGTTRFTPLKTSYASSSRSLSGRWKASLQVTSNNCPFSAKNFSGTVNLKENNKRVTLSIPGRAAFSGSKSGRGFRTSGRYHVPLSLCSANVSVSASSVTQTFANVDAKADVYCSRRPYCSISAKGNLSR